MPAFIRDAAVIQDPAFNRSFMVDTVLVRGRKDVWPIKSASNPLECIDGS